MAAICMHCYVSGRVQGVFYRRHTEKEATARGLTGWVKNLEDGRVEVMVCGEKEKVDSLVQWLWQGPSSAKVSEVEVEELQNQSFTHFEVR